MFMFFLVLWWVVYEIEKVGFKKFISNFKYFEIKYLGFQVGVL